MNPVSNAIEAYRSAKATTPILYSLEDSYATMVLASNLFEDNTARFLYGKLRSTVNEREFIEILDRVSGGLERKIHSMNKRGIKWSKNHAAKAIAHAISRYYNADSIISKAKGMAYILIAYEYAMEAK